MKRIIESIEPLHQKQFENFCEAPVILGPYTSHIWRTDPRHLGFLLARYKFIAKMLEGKKRVLEVGCGDCFGIPVVLQTVKSVHAIDREPFLFENIEHRLPGMEFSYSCTDITKESPKESFDAAYSLDVIEHIPLEDEDSYVRNTCASLDDNGVFIVGTPNVTAKPYSSELSMIGHINLKSSQELRNLMGKYFHNVFMFSLNDEVVHTGYAPMAHYLFAMGVGKK